MNEKEPNQGWGILYSGFDSSIYSKIVGAFSKGAVTLGQIGTIENGKNRPLLRYRYLNLDKGILHSVNHVFIENDFVRKA